MAKRYRAFRRINMTAKIAEFLETNLVDLTFNDHYKKCLQNTTEDCSHNESRSLHVARLVEAGLHIGKKRAYLDVPCPWLSALDPEDAINLLEHLVARLKDFTKDRGGSNRTRGVLYSICQEIEDYAHRNAMEVLAEQSVDL